MISKLSVLKQAKYDCKAEQCRLFDALKTVFASNDGKLDELPIIAFRIKSVSRDFIELKAPAEVLILEIDDRRYVMWEDPTSTDLGPWQIYKFLTYEKRV